MDLLLHKFLKESKIEKKDFNEVSKVLTRLLNEKYNEKVILEQLVHQANFDKDVFLNYFMDRVMKEDKPICTLQNHEKSNELGFDKNSIFGSIVIGLTDYFFKAE